MGQVSFGDHNGPGGIFVEPVHNAGALHTANAQQLVAAVGQHPIDQGAAQVTGGGVHHQTGGFVENNQVLVFVENIEGNGLGG